MLTPVAVWIPWYMFEPLPEWLRAPVVIGVFRNLTATPSFPFRC
jgi:hypothetical protein